MGAWSVSALVALQFVNLPGQFVGTLGNLAGGVDISLPLGLAVATVLYLALLWLFPEPREVFGPEGPRFVPSSQTPVPPIVTTGGVLVQTTAGV